jgi:hypothetical protein
MSGSNAFSAPGDVARDESESRHPNLFPAGAGFAVAALGAIAALAGVLLPSIYERETASLAAQGVGQDWVCLVVVIPFLVLAAARSLTGSRTARLLLAGGFMYMGYSYAIYAFGIHFNALFLVYCSLIGLSVFGLVSLAAGILRDDVRSWFGSGVPRRLAGWLQIGIAVVFAGMWLADIVPALLRGDMPRAVAQDNLVTNPVYVLDLSLALPAFVLGGIMLLRRRSLGYFLAPALLTFALLMALALGGMIVLVYLRGLAADPTVAVVFAVVAATCATTLALVLRCL